MAPKFSLQSVLDVRHSRVEALEIALSELLMHQQEARAMLESIKNWRKSLFEQLNQQLHGEMDLYKVDHLHVDINNASEQVTHYTNVLAEMEIKVTHKRQEVIAAKQAEEVLGILKEKEQERFRAEQAQVEGRVKDDIYISRAYRLRQQRI